eukprot:scaffold25_cov162-Chaetoceros_neogracile.AAC.2
MRGDEDMAKVIIYNNFQDLLIRVSKTIVSRREGREQKRRQRTAESLPTWVFTTLDNGATSWTLDNGATSSDYGLSDRVSAKTLC